MALAQTYTHAPNKNMEVILTALFTLIAYKLNRVKQWLHVGHIIGPGTHQAMAKGMCHDFIWRVNALSANLGFII